MNLEIPFDLEKVFSREMIRRIRDTVRQALVANHDQFSKAVLVDGSRFEILPDQEGIDLITADSGHVRFRSKSDSGQELSVFFSINWRKGTLTFGDSAGVITSEDQ